MAMLTSECYREDNNDEGWELMLDDGKADINVFEEEILLQIIHEDEMKVL